MAGKLLLDTHVVIALWERNSAVTGHICEYDEVFVPSIAIGELFFGAYRSGRIEDNLARVSDFCRSCVVLAADHATARIYGELKSRLRTTGRPIPENDLWIASIALQHRIPLATRDRHFEEIESLSGQLVKL
jgi:tRNA(fMet)-specific endonuclease VapC